MLMHQFISMHSPTPIHLSTLMHLLKPKECICWRLYPHQLCPHQCLHTCAVWSSSCQLQRKCGESIRCWGIAVQNNFYFRLRLLTIVHHSLKHCSMILAMGEWCKTRNSIGCCVIEYNIVNLSGGDVPTDIINLETSARSPGIRMHLTNSAWTCKRSSLISWFDRSSLLP